MSLDHQADALPSFDSHANVKSVLSLCLSVAALQDHLELARPGLVGHPSLHMALLQVVDLGPLRAQPQAHLDGLQVLGTILPSQQFSKAKATRAWNFHRTLMSLTPARTYLP